MRFKLLILLALYSGLANADWSGVAFDIADSDSDWIIGNDLRKVRSTELIFRIEETTEPGLRIGGRIGQVNLRIDGDANTPNYDFDISWTEIDFYFGTSLKLSHIRISPLVIYQSVDGDVSDDFGSHDFELDDPMSAAIRFDYFVEKTAFVRLQFTTGNSEGILLSFAREY